MKADPRYLKQKAKKENFKKRSIFWRSKYLISFLLTKLFLELFIFAGMYMYVSAAAKWNVRIGLNMFSSLLKLGQWNEVSDINNFKFWVKAGFFQ